MGNIVQFSDIRNLFLKIIIDYELGKVDFEGVNLNLESDADNLIQNYIKPVFDNLDENQKRWLKNSLSYFITYEPDRLQSLDEDGTIPIEFSTNSQSFFIKIWEALYNNAEYKFKGKPDKILY